MSTERLVFCKHFKKELPGLRRPPFPGELGQEIFETASQEAWQQWLKRQTMFINEYRLNVTEPAAKQFLQNHMRTFLFEQVDAKPSGYVAKES